MEPEARFRAALDRIFAFTSVLPIAAFCGLHLADYARTLFGETEIGLRARPTALVLALELLLVWLPLGFHAMFGVSVWLRRRKISETTPSQRAAVAVHRLTGAIVALFLIDHFVRFRLPILRGERFPSDSVQVLAGELSRTDAGVPWLAAISLLGTAAAAFHLGYGLYRIAERSPRLSSSLLARRAGLGVGVAFGLLGILTVLHLATG